ncbi:MAG: hypothetical protein JSU66_15360 [Deltaproteobacteria bacterium]|nr:MAG: hypothetical protein JSU66_15360 [Deltaproteobacteria bacterium]
MRALRLFSCAGLLGLLLPPWANAQDVVVTAGPEGAYYHTLGGRLEAALRNEYGTRVEVRTSQGSLENLARLDDPSNPANVGLTQADALRHYIDAHDAFAETFIVLADVGKECAFIIAGKNGGIASAADLKAPGKRTLSVGDAQSGAAITYEYMSRLDPGFRNTAVVHVGMMEALLQIKAGGEFATLDAAMLVQRPRITSPPLKAVLDNLDTYRVVPIRSGDLGNAALPGGRPVYSFETVTVGFGRDHSVTFDTLCTPGLLIAVKPKLDPKTLDELAKVILSRSNDIMPSLD